MDEKTWLTYSSMVVVYVGVGASHLILNPRYVAKLQLKEKKRAKEEESRARWYIRKQEKDQSSAKVEEDEQWGDTIVIDDVTMLL